MYKGKKFTAVILAAGMGQRMNMDIPKQYIELNGKPIIINTLIHFLEFDEFDEIILVVADAYLKHVKKMVNRYLAIEDVQRIRYVVGGEERQDSVRLALNDVNDECDYVMIHDGARPFVSRDVISRNLEAVITDKAVATVVPLKDTIRTEYKTLNRNELYSVQTPQTFAYNAIKAAYNLTNIKDLKMTDDASVLEGFGVKVKLVEGEYANYKITTKEDLPMDMRIGNGYDVHKLVDDRELILGGVKIPYEKGLLGHSDADVLLHALMDSILGAMAMGDIGKHFPDSDDRYKGISSLKLCERVNRLMKKQGYILSNCDVTVIAQEPKISAYIDDMRKNIAKVFEVGIDAVSIKGTTTEKLGFEGRGEGIAVEAVSLIKKF